MPRGVYERKKRCPLKKRIICNKCLNVFYPDINIKEVRRECPYCHSIIDIRDKSKYYIRYGNKYPEKRKKKYEVLAKREKKYLAEGAKKIREKHRTVVLNIISGSNPHCVRCSCDDKRLLEINHKNGGGRKELHGGKNQNQFIMSIYMGRRKTDDLELLCRVCNAWHYLELKYGKLPYEISYKR